MASSEGSCFTCKEDLYKAQPCFKCPACYKCFHLACTTMETYTTKLDENLRNVGDQKRISPEQLDIAVGDMKSAFKAMSTQCPSEELSGQTNDDVVVIDGSKNTANDVDSEKLLNDNDNKIVNDSETISELNQGTDEATTYTSKKDSVSGNQMDLNGIIEDPKDGNAIIIEMDPKKIRDLIEGMEGNTIEYTQQVNKYMYIFLIRLVRKFLGYPIKLTLVGYNNKFWVPKVNRW